MKKMMMIAVMAMVAMTASAQNTLRDNGTFTLQPKVGLALGSFSGDYAKGPGESDPKVRAGLIAGPPHGRLLCCPRPGPEDRCTVRLLDECKE